MLLAREGLEVVAEVEKSSNLKEVARRFDDVRGGGVLAPRRPSPMMAYMDKANEFTGSALVNQLVDVIWGATEIVEPLIESVDRLAPEKLSRLSE